MNGVNTPTAEKAAPLSFRLSGCTKSALEAAAKKERRSVSNLVETLLADWLSENGYLPERRLILLPPPDERGSSSYQVAATVAETPTLTELAALIREAAETNPFVRPLADLLEGRI